MTFIFVPDPVGVRGNERPDQLAESVVVEEGQAMDLANIINDVRETGRTKDFTDKWIRAVEKNKGAEKWKLVWKNMSHWLNAPETCPVNAGRL